jgi:hypothetical protein
MVRQAGQAETGRIARLYGKAEVGFGSAVFD